jgi:hypothetical protein
MDIIRGTWSFTELDGVLWLIPRGTALNCYGIFSLGTREVTPPVSNFNYFDYH